MRNLQRRRLLTEGVKVAAGLSLLPLVNRAYAAEQACVTPASESLRQSLNYVDPSPDKTQQCSACAFFAARSACGDCQILSGPVSSTARCESWAARS